MLNNKKSIVASVAGALLLGTVLAAQADRSKPDPSAAELNLGAAMELALAEVPGTVVDAELEQKKDGKLVWEFEIVSADEAARMDVDIDANSGELLNSEPDGKHGKHGKRGHDEHK